MVEGVLALERCVATCKHDSLRQKASAKRQKASKSITVDPKQHYTSVYTFAKHPASMLPIDSSARSSASFMFLQKSLQTFWLQSEQRFKARHINFNKRTHQTCLYRQAEETTAETSNAAHLAQLRPSHADPGHKEMAQAAN